MKGSTQGFGRQVLTLALILALASVVDYPLRGDDSSKNNDNGYNFLENVNALTFEGPRPPSAATPDLWPVKGPLMASFGERADPFTGEGEFHKGVDIGAAAGTPVRATADGVVVFSGWDGGYGRLVIIDHGADVHTYYAHLSRFYAQMGRVVRRGEVLGEVGSTGRATAPHLHYEVRIRDRAVNPYKYQVRSSIRRLRLKTSRFR
jgi:murein DD-endopeptidase MepM/ murein hydrolase activator NlpD